MFTDHCSTDLLAYTSTACYNKCSHGNWSVLCCIGFFGGDGDFFEIGLSV